MSDRLTSWLKGEIGLDIPEAFQLSQDYLSELLDGSPRERHKKMAENFLLSFLFKTQLFQPFCCGGLGYLLPADGQPPIAVTSDGHEFNHLLLALGIHPGSPTRDRIGKFIGTFCHQFGTQTDARVSFHYDPERHTAYFAEGIGQLIRVTASEITRVPNGTDGQLFLFPKGYEPWALDLASLPPATDFCPDLDALLPNLIFDVLEFDNEALTREDLHVLLNAYVATLFLPGIVAGKLLLQVLGDTGSAKTFFLRLLGRLIYGRKFEVTGMDTKEDQFENALVNNAFIVLDDVKRTSNANILAMLRRACTGGSCKRRELYSTFKQVEEPYRAAIALTCSEEPFSASDEMTNRSLVIRVKQRDDYQDEIDLLKRVDAKRNQLMAEMMVRLQNVILATRAQANFKPKVKMRMASFATFLLRVGRHWDWGQSAQQVLEAWREEQEGAGLDASIMGALDAWMGTPDWKSQRYSAEELYKELIKHNVSVNPWWFGKAPALIRALRRAAHAYHRHYGFEFIPRSSGPKGPQYWFNPSDELLTEIRRRVLGTAPPGEAQNQGEIPF